VDRAEARGAREELECAKRAEFRAAPEDVRGAAFGQVL
jgi:hypothetical protein